MTVITSNPAAIEVDPDHTEDGWCWCQPRIEHYTDAFGDEAEVIVHKHLMDMPDT